MGAAAAGPPRVVGRVAGDVVEGLRGKDLPDATIIPFQDPNSILEGVQSHGTTGHLHHIGLNLEAYHTASGVPGGQDQGDDAAARAEIQDAPSPQWPGEMGEKDGVHGEPVSGTFLKDADPAVEEGIQGLIFPDIGVDHGPLHGGRARVIRVGALS
jgi:hypothetical protein